MRKVQPLIVVFLGVLFSIVGWGQNTFGTISSNYTPTNSVYLNPSSMLDAKVWLDINLVGVGTYVNNDLVYLKNHSGISAVQSGIRGTNVISESDIGFNQKRKRYHAYNRNFVALPSVVWSQGDHAAGLSLGVRSYTGARRIPDYIAEFIEHGIPDHTAQHNIDYSLEKMRVASLHFGEVKLSYAHTFWKKGKDMLMAGVTISKFFSGGGAGVNIERFDFRVNNDSVADVFHLNADAMYTPQPEFYVKGGMGLDLGFTWQRMLDYCSNYYPNTRKGGCNRKNYLYKLGVSIIDIGSMKVNNDAKVYAGYNFDDFNWVNYTDAEANEDNVTDFFENQESNITEGEVKKPWKIRLPTFISGQFDYNLWRSKVYVNATIIQGFTPGKKRFGLRHANSLSVTPRYESYWIDFALPFSLYEYKYPQLGASLRLGPLTIGTDKLINWIAKSRIYGADFYFYLKIPVRYHPSCKDRLKSKRKRFRDKSPTKCTI